MHIVHSARRARTAQLVHRRGDEARPACAERMPDGDRAAVRVDVRRVVRHAEAPQHGKCLSRERFVQLDHVHAVNREPGPREQLLRRGTGPMPITRGSTPATAEATYTRARRETVRANGVLGREKQRRAAIVDARTRCPP